MLLIHSITEPKQATHFVVLIVSQLYQLTFHSSPSKHIWILDYAYSYHSNQTSQALHWKHIHSFFSKFHTSDLFHLSDLCGHPEWPHRQGSCHAFCGCTFESRRGCADLYYARGAQGVLLMRVGGATSQLDLVSDAVVRSLLWLTATRGSPLGCFSTLLQVVNNWPHILW